jgi:hypothetical protein
MQDRIVEFARHRQRPEPGAGSMDAGKVGRQAGRPQRGDLGTALAPIQRNP